MLTAPRITRHYTDHRHKPTRQQMIAREQLKALHPCFIKY